MTAMAASAPASEDTVSASPRCRICGVAIPRKKGPGRNRKHCDRHDRIYKRVYMRMAQRRHRARKRAQREFDGIDKKEVKKV